MAYAIRFSANERTSGIGRLSRARVRSEGFATGVPSYILPRVSSSTPDSRYRQRPVTSKLSSESPIGSMYWWHALHVGFLRWISIRSRVVNGRPSFPSDVSSSVGTFGGGGGGGIPIRTSITHLPRSTGEGRFASDVWTSILPWPSSPRRVPSG